MRCAATFSLAHTGAIWPYTWSLVDASSLGLERTLEAPDAEPRRRHHHHDRWRHEFGFPDILFGILFGFELFSMAGVRCPSRASPAALHATGRLLSARFGCPRRDSWLEYVCGCLHHRRGAADMRMDPDAAPWGSLATAYW